MLPTAVRIGVLCEDEGGGEMTELEMTETGVVGVDRGMMNCLLLKT